MNHSCRTSRSLERSSGKLERKVLIEAKGKQIVYTRKQQLNRAVPNTFVASIQHPRQQIKSVRGKTERKWSRVHKNRQAAQLKLVLYVLFLLVRMKSTSWQSSKQDVVGRHCSAISWCIPVPTHHLNKIIWSLALLNGKFKKPCLIIPPLQI